MLTIKDLENKFENAIETEYLMIGVAVQLPNLEKPEIIINPFENFEEKLKYYKNAYNDDLTLKNCKDIKIIGVCAGDYADEIFCKLMI